MPTQELRWPRVLARRAWTLTTVGSVAVAVVVSASGVANASPPDASGIVASGRLSSETVQAVLVDSLLGCSVTYNYATLNQDWAEFGSVPLVVSTGGNLCAGQFSLADLEASGADVVVLDDTAAFFKISKSELAALRAYAEEGHEVVGVGLDFQAKKINNDALAGLFGLNPDLAWHEAGSLRGSAPPTYPLRFKNPAATELFSGLSDPYVSADGGYDEMPSDKKWTKSDLAGASFLSVNGDRHTAITYCDADGFPAIYIGSNAEFDDGPADLQFLYNALTYAAQAGGRANRAQVTQ